MIIGFILLLMDYKKLVFILIYLEFVLYKFICSQRIKHIIELLSYKLLASLTSEFGLPHTNSFIILGGLNSLKVSK